MDKRIGKLGKIGDEEHKLADYEYWKKLGATEIFRNAWELVITAYEMKGRDIGELRFQRSVENIQRKKG